MPAEHRLLEGPNWAAENDLARLLEEVLDQVRADLDGEDEPVVMRALTAATITGARIGVIEAEAIAVG